MISPSSVAVCRVCYLLSVSRTAEVQVTWQKTWWLSRDPVYSNNVNIQAKELMGGCLTHRSFVQSGVSSLDKRPVNLSINVSKMNNSLVLSSTKSALTPTFNIITPSSYRRGRASISARAQWYQSSKLSPERFPPCLFQTVVFFDGFYHIFTFYFTTSDP